MFRLPGVLLEPPRAFLMLVVRLLDIRLCDTQYPIVLCFLQWHLCLSDYHGANISPDI